MNGLLHDLRYALRQLRKSPGFTAVAVITLALGIGANTGIFTLVNAVLLKSLPVPEPDQLFLVRQRDRFAEQTRVSYPLYSRMSQAMPTSASLAAMTLPSDFYLSTGTGVPEMTKGLLVSGNYFETLETYPILGRLLTPADNQTIDGHSVAVISYSCWQNRFASDPNVIGREILINGVRFNVVGVTAAHFFGIQPGRSPDLWLPLMMQSSLHFAQHYSKSTTADADKPWVSQEDITWLELMARVTERSELPHIAGVLNQLELQNKQRNPIHADAVQGQQLSFDNQFVLDPGGQGVESLQREFSKPLLVLTAMVGMVLLIACANLAGLLLARATGRSREIAVRLSIGATKARLVRQLLTECLLLSVFGGALGMMVAYGCDVVLPKWASGGSLPIPLNLAPDSRILLFSIGMVLATGVLFGLIPALQASKVEPVSALKATASRGITGSGSASPWSARHMLIVAQFGFSLVLLVGAGLFARTLRNFVQLDPGFDRNHLLTVWIDTNVRHYSHDQLLSFFHEVIDRAQSLPGVRSASIATCGLATSCRSASDIYLPGHSQVTATPQVNIVSLHYFNNVGISVVRGRDFTAADGEKAPHVVIINQTLARDIFAGVDPIGQHFGFETNSANEFQIVGVVADAHVNGVRESAPPMIYFPLFQFVADVESLDIRTASNPAALTQQVRQLLASIDPDLPIGRITTMTEQVSSNLAQERMIAWLTAIFAGVALSLACLGLYGVLSYTVALRTSELGVRMALGASRSEMLWLILRQTLILSGFGITGGLLLSLISAQAVRSLLFGLSPYDPATLAGATALLFAVSLASSMRPAWRAAKVDPIVALRYE
jgi:predicted permease